MRKYLRILSVSLAAFVFMLAFSVAALAETFTGGNMSVEVPAGWKASYQERLNQIVLESQDGLAVAGVQVVDSGGASHKEFAEALSSALNGSAPQQIDGYNNYYITVNIDGVDCLITVFVEGPKALVFMEGGANDKYEKEINAIWNSMKSKDAAEQAIFAQLNQNY